MVSVLRWMTLALAFAAAAVPTVAAVTETDAPFFSERMSLESARYLFDIERDSTAANRLLDSLRQSRNEGIRNQANYLTGRILEAGGRPDPAMKFYSQALGGRGLSQKQKGFLLARLQTLNPGLLQPLRTAGKSRGLPVKVFPTVEGEATRYVFVEESGNPAGLAPGLSWQDAEGLLHPLKVALAPGEEVLDATPEVLLTVDRPRQQHYVRSAPAFEPVFLAEKFPAREGLIFSGKSGEFLLIGSQNLRVIRRGQTVFSHPLPGPGCEYRPSSPRSRRGIIFCPSQGVYRADFKRGILTAMRLGGEVPIEAALSDEYLALRHSDRIEVRRGPTYEAPLWRMPSGMQDQLTLGRRHAFVVGSEGRLRAFDLRTGQLEWQREEDISAVLPADGVVFALTHDHNCLALDEKGRTLFTYEAGWGADPLLLPTGEWLVVQKADGKRVRLNLEFLRLTGGDRNYLFQEIEKKLQRRDTKGAVNSLNGLLELEPGNGTAWTMKAQILGELGATKREQTEAWLQASRSQATGTWSEDLPLQHLSRSLGASWVWKRHVGPRFFPVLTPGRHFSFYTESDNQTLVLLNNETGKLHSSFRFPEPLDMKAAIWAGDTAIVSSPGHLYLLSPTNSSGVLARIPLRSPICQAMSVPGGLVYSDWNGTLRLLDLPSRRQRWESHPGRSGLFMARGRNSDMLDVFDIEGGYHGIHLPTGRDLVRANLPPGTITEVHAGPALAFAGYNEGLLLAVDRANGSLAWKKDMGEQIFSMAGKGEMLLVGTASKRILTLRGATGAIQSQTSLPIYLFNRPLVVEDGYWVGTTEPALEKRSMAQVLLEKLPLTDMPGTPSLVGGGIAISTLDHFIIRFPVR